MTDTPDLQDRIAAVITPYFANFSGEEAARENAAEAAAAVSAALPGVRALSDAADFYDRLLTDMGDDVSKDPRYWTGVQHVVMGLRARAGQNETPAPCGPTPDQCDAEAGEPCANHEREQAHAEDEHAFCGPECAEAEPTAEETVRSHVTTLHLIGEQLAGIETWMWEHLANVRDAAQKEA